TGGYYFKATLDATKHTFKLSGVSDYIVTAEKVVIPYKFLYNGIEYTFDTTASYILTGGKAISTNPGIRTLIVSEGITKVGSNGFRALRGITTVRLPSTIKTIGSLCFAGDKEITTINLPEGLETIETGALQFTAIPSVTVPSTVKEFGGSMFYGCTKLTEVNFLFPYTTLPGTTFRSCTALKSFTIPDVVDTVGSFAFSGAGITELVLPEKVTAITKQLASVANSLKTVIVKGEVTSIDTEAFKNSAALRTITFEGKNAPTIASTNSFSGCKLLTVNYPADGVGYNATEWQAFFPTDTTFVRAQGEPMVENLVLDGINVVDTTLTTSYTYIDPMGRAESGSVAVWEVCEEADFTSSEVFPLKVQECSASNPPSYMIQETNDGKYIRVTITPKNADSTLNVGAPVYAQLTEKVRLPQTMPIVTLTAPSDGFMANANKPINLAATAACDNTTITKIEYYANNTKVAEATAAPYETTWTPTEMGDYTIYARAYNALGEDDVSSNASVTVLSEDAEIGAYITIEYTTPVAGSTILTGTEIAFTGTVVESSGSAITELEIFANGKTLGIAMLTPPTAVEGSTTASPYTFALNKTLDVGNYTIKTIAKSADGKIGIGSEFDLMVSGMNFPKMICDNMVLQRNKRVKLTGFGTDGTVVTAEILGNKASATVVNGKWQIILPPMPTTQSTTLKFSASDGTVKTMQNVAIGEVIICSGQSNMTAGIGNQHTFASYNPKPGIRLFKTSSGDANSPQDDVLNGTWDVTTTTLIKAFSSVGYLTGYNYFMSQNEQVPVGLIQSAVSGSGISLWVPNDAFDYDPDNKKLDKTETFYNQMIAPWTGYTIGHILWYQGESDSQHSRLYEKSLTSYIQSYREQFDEDLNFIIVQLPVYDAVAGYSSAFRHFWIVREGEYNVSKHFEGVETVVTIDTGSIGSVHPGGKDKVGLRAGLILQNFASPDPDLVWKSPNYDYHEIVDGKAIIYFNDVGAGLSTKDGLAPTAFKVAGDDMNFVNANATLVGNTVEIDVSGIVGTPYIRYACEDVPNRIGSTWNVNLVNSAGLPMAPFRTDDAKIQFKSYDSATGTYSNPYNFTPMIKGITDTPVKNGTAVITIDARGFDDDVNTVELFIDGISVGNAVQSTENEDIWTYNWTQATEGSHTFHAIATDEFDLTSVANDEKTVTPRKYTYSLEKENTDVTIMFDKTNGAVATTTLDGILVIAAYNANNELVQVKLTEEKTASLNAVEVGNAIAIKAFVIDGYTSIRPLSGVVKFEVK
ncbi:MAG: leucine-rich repeat protein, partial [Eubacteriales bacterium]|nr:leucine-rich repeat protein [Eubacteriales bacterium]